MEERGHSKMNGLYEGYAMASSGNYRKFKIDPETGAKYVHL